MRDAGIAAEISCMRERPHMARIDEPGLWHHLTLDEREDWLRDASRRCFARSQPWPPELPPGSEIVVAGATITDLTSFLCALGEAINGPGGYFGWSFHSLQDCAVGGFGAAPPFVVRWLDLDRARHHFGHAGYARWLRREIRGGNGLTPDGEPWAVPALADALAGRGPTLFDSIAEAIAVRGSTIAPG